MKKCSQITECAVTSQMTFGQVSTRLIRTVHEIYELQNSPAEMRILGRLFNRVVKHHLGLFFGDFIDQLVAAGKIKVKMSTSGQRTVYVPEDWQRHRDLLKLLNEEKKFSLPTPIPMEFFDSV